MSEHCGYVVRIKELRKHPNADRLQLATIFGNTTQVPLSVQVGDIGIYFPSDLQMAQDFCVYNHLCRKKPDGTPDSGYLDPDKRNIKTVKLRGEPSDGIFLPLSCLDYFEHPPLNEGDRIDVLNGYEICKKYIPNTQKRIHVSEGNRTRRTKGNISPLFAEHADTEQLAYNLNAFRIDDDVEITLKLHGTSQRTGYLPVLSGYSHKNPILNKIINMYYGKEDIGVIAQKLLDMALINARPVYSWNYITGTRRTVCSGDFEGGFYGSNKFRQQHAEVFNGKLHKGEEVYYEVVGFMNETTPIMGSVSNKRTNDKQFIKQYGETTVFSYGCDPNGANGLPQSDIYVYRMTMTNEDGDVVEYTPEFMRYRCEQIGVKTVPVLWRGRIADKVCHGYEYCEYDVCSPGTCLQEIAKEYCDGADPIGKTHIREGVVARIVNRPKFCAYKCKNIYFKIIEGLFKEEATAPDIEEAQEIEVQM